MVNKRISILLLGTFFWVIGASAQISPGKLAKVHAHLEGISNCTKCHTLGAQVSNDKCLACHTDIKARVDQKKGYHSSSAIKGKTCVSCHSDHHGENFQIVRFNSDKFDHNLTGFSLTGAHTKKLCKDCHKPDHIADKKIRAKKGTYLGVSAECLTCHEDYHQQSLAPTCTNCHGFDAFKPAAKFNHTNAKFQLTGKHETVECIKCHKVTTTQGKKFQQFTGVAYKSCSNCHTDPHHGKFGANCNECHSGESFHTIKGQANFNHSKTAFPLVDKHLNVACKSCHKTKVTDPVKHEKCSDCHTDYHSGQFVKQNVAPDCSKCHSTKGFPGSSFTLEQHNTTSNFKLEGAHLATPCFTCHKKQEKWSFRNIGMKCADCHDNIHNTFMDAKYFQDPGCLNCHNVNTWKEVVFDHSKTTFPLQGVHAKQTCRACHFNKALTGHEKQQFSSLGTNCTVCHTDKHFNQFDVGGKTTCERCHGYEKWKIETFDHDKTSFKLDQSHRKVPCAKCHKTVTQGEISFVLYKIKETKCENCH
jgi:hypothetical protein